MTRRERITAILNKQPVDGLAPTTPVGKHTLNSLSRYIGCDIFLLNNWGIQPGFSSPEFLWPKEVTVSSRRDDNKTIYKLKKERCRKACLEAWVE